VNKKGNSQALTKGEKLTKTRSSFLDHSGGPIQTTRPRGRFVIGTQEPKNFWSTSPLVKRPVAKIIKVFLLLFVHKKKFFLPFLSFSDRFFVRTAWELPKKKTLSLTVKSVDDVGVI
jgi:hypothetical protein